MDVKSGRVAPNKTTEANSVRASKHLREGKISVLQGFHQSATMLNILIFYLFFFLLEVTQVCSDSL